MDRVSGMSPLYEWIERKASTSVESVFVSDKSKTSPMRTVWRKLLPFNNSGGLAPCPASERLQHVAASKKILLRLKREPNAVALLTAGESQFNSVFTNVSATIRRRVFVIFHQPESWMKLHWRDFDVLNGLAGIFCFGRKQSEFFSSKTKCPVHVISHGVALDFFDLPKREEEGTSSKLLFVGAWLRDFELLYASMKHIWHLSPNVKLTCIIPHRARNSDALLRLAEDRRVSFFADLSAEDLRETYHSSSLIFIPFIDTVANNSIVEAQACGLPVVTSMVGDIEDYISPWCTAVTKQDPMAHAQAAVLALNTVCRDWKIRKEIRAYAERSFDWANCSQQIVNCILSDNTYEFVR